MSTRTDTRARRPRAHRRRGLLLIGVVLVVIVGAVGYWFSGDAKPTRSPTESKAKAAPPARGGERRRVRALPAQLVERRTGSLPAPLQDAAAVGATRGALLLGGLTAADTSTDQVLLTRAGGARPQGPLPTGLHDAAAVRLGTSTYVFGGGTGTRQLDSIVRVGGAQGP
ncbi:MAG: hypothetical protein C5B48_03675, partial [Candidatus Rokuibacteriota bacterium]